MIRTALPTVVTLRRTFLLTLLAGLGMSATLAGADDLRVDCAVAAKYAGIAGRVVGSDQSLCGSRRSKCGNDAVIAMTAKTGNMQGQLDLVWEHLLPAFHVKPLVHNETELTKLRQTLAGLRAGVTE